VRLIWAQARGGVIGADGTLPWRLPEDLHHFKTLTTGGTVVMGRRTWESLPGPLPGRRNVVLTSRDLDVETARTVEEVLAEHPDAWVIGGGAVYAAFLPYASDAVVTEIDLEVDGDTWAPSLTGWELIERHPHTSRTGLPYAFAYYRPGTVKA
jgi:dihydrofolate reductase